MKTQVKKINSQEELDELLDGVTENENNPLECFIQLNYGIRSSKEIYRSGEDYYIYNDVDDTDEIIEHDKLMDSFIGKAIKSGSLYKW